MKYTLKDFGETCESCCYKQVCPAIKLNPRGSRYSCSFTYKQANFLSKKTRYEIETIEKETRY